VRSAGPASFRLAPLAFAAGARASAGASIERLFVSRHCWTRLELLGRAVSAHGRPVALPPTPWGPARRSGP
jgi:hypothetical protein